MGRKSYFSQPSTEGPAEGWMGWLWVDRKPAIPSTLENGFCVYHNKKAFLPSRGEEVTRLAQSNPSLKGDSVLDPGILDTENEGSWGVGAVSGPCLTPHQYQVGRAGQFSNLVCLGLIPSKSCVALAKSLALRDLFFF